MLPDQHIAITFIDYREPTSAVVDQREINDRFILALIDRPMAMKQNFSALVAYRIIQSADIFVIIKDKMDKPGNTMGTDLERRR